MNYRDNATPSKIVSGAFGIEIITLSSSAGQGADQQCREVTIWPEDGESIKIGNTAVIASTGPILWNDNGYMVLPVANTNLLFFGGTTGKKVYLLWRS